MPGPAASSSSARTGCCCGSNWSPRGSCGSASPRRAASRTTSPTPIDPDFAPETPEHEVLEIADAIAIRCGGLSIRVARADLKVTVTDIASGRVVSKDEKGFHWEDNPEYGGEIVKMSKACHHGEHFYGLGDKSCDLNLRGRRFELWGSDTYAYGPDTDPLYKNIPFYISLNASRAHGIFFDNTFRSGFDFGSERATVTSFFAQGGEMNYYLIDGPDPLEVIRRYTRLTGLAEMPPLWALGYHQCKWSYYPEAVVRSLARGFRKRRIPCDALYLDIDYMDGYRCFTWDGERFPDPARMVADLEEDGFKTVAIIDPGLKIDPDYRVWAEALDRRLFCRRQDGNLFKGSVWPGLCHFPDFTRPEAREWWAGPVPPAGRRGRRPRDLERHERARRLRGGHLPPNDVRHDFDGHPCSHRKAHNVYGMQMVRATREGLSTVRRRAAALLDHPLRLCRHPALRLRLDRRQRRQLGAPQHRQPPVPAARLLRDVLHRLRHRRLPRDTHAEALPALGPAGGLPPLLPHPLLGRPRRTGTLVLRRQDVTDGVRAAIELRYRLLPAVYTAFRQYVRDGTPMLRSLPFVDFRNPETYWRSAEFFFGDHLYVVPGHGGERRTGRFLYLPHGEWFSYHDDTRPKAVNKDIWIDCPEDGIPGLRPRRRGGAPLAGAAACRRDRAPDPGTPHLVDRPHHRQRVVRGRRRRPGLAPWRLPGVAVPRRRGPWKAPPPARVAGALATGLRLDRALLLRNRLQRGPAAGPDRRPPGRGGSRRGRPLPLHDPPRLP